MGGAIEAPEKQAIPHSYSFYYHSLVTRHNNTEYFISINFTGVDIRLSICKCCLLTMLILVGCPCVCVDAMGGGGLVRTHHCAHLAMCVFFCWVFQNPGVANRFLMIKIMHYSQINHKTSNYLTCC